jgi:hypothetical protein
LNRPLSFKDVPVKKQLAELYISDSVDFYNKLPTNYRDVKYQRVAYLRLRLEIVHSLNKQEQTGTMGGKSAVVIGRAVGYEIYADAKKQKLLFAENFKLKKIRKKLGADEKPSETEKDGTGVESSADGAEQGQSAPEKKDDAVVQSVESDPVLTGSESTTNATSGDTPAANHQ